MRRKDKKRMLGLFWLILPFSSVILIWELLVDIGMVNSAFLPPPSKILTTFCRLMYPNPILLHHLYKSFYRLIIGYSLAMLAGIGLGLLLGTNRFAYYGLYPIISLLIPIPTIAWVPLFLITLGIGDRTIIITVFLGGFFPVVYNTMNGVRSVEKRVLWASQIMGVGPVANFFRVLLPGSLVSIITGSRLAIGYSWRALVGAEMLAATSWGLGYMIYAARSFYDVQAMFVGLVIIAIGGYLMDRVFMGWLEKKTIERWGMVMEI